MTDTSNRLWRVTLNADDEGNLMTPDEMGVALKNYRWAGQIELGGKKKRRHWQIYIDNDSPIRFSTLKSKLGDEVHLEAGVHETGPYVGRLGGFDYATKDETRVDGPYGTLLRTALPGGTTPRPKRSKMAPRLEEWKRQIREEGVTAKQIIRDDVEAHRYIYWLQLQEEYYLEDLGERFRDVKVHVECGFGGTGKTERVYKNHSIRDIYKVTNYHHFPFDRYRGQRVLMLDEFRGDLKLGLFLDVIDTYPVDLPRRRSHHPALYTDVYITSNIPYEEFYPDVDERSWSGLSRRITDYSWVREDGTRVPQDLELYKSTRTTVL